MMWWSPAAPAAPVTLLWSARPWQGDSQGSPLLFDDQKEEENLRHWNSRWKEKEKENVRKLHGKLRKRKMTLVQ
jgi:hypothetical protein